MDLPFTDEDSFGLVQAFKAAQITLVQQSLMLAGVEAALADDPGNPIHAKLLEAVAAATDYQHALGRIIKLLSPRPLSEVDSTRG